MFYSFDLSSITAAEACLALACVMFMPTPANADISVDQVFENARTVVGADKLAKSPQGWRCDGRAKQFGLDSSCDMLFSSHGEFVFGVDGRLGTKTGFDGTTAWQIDPSRTGCVLSQQDREASIVVYWILTGVWTLKQDELDALILPEKSTEDHIALSIKPNGGVLRAVLLIDRKTSLPHSITVDGPIDRTWTFDDYRSTNGVFMAHHFTDQWIKDSRNEYWVNGISQAPIFVRNPYEPLLSLPDDAKFTKKGAEIELRISPTGHLMIHPKLNGKDIGWFIFDSGAGQSVVSKEAADELSLEELGQIAVGSIFGLESKPFRPGASFELGPITIRDVSFIEMDMSPLKPYFEVPLVGVIGYDVLSRCVVELDLRNQKVSIHDPKSYERPNTLWQELILQIKIPSVLWRFAGDREGLFRIDTGASGGPWGAVIFHSPAVEEMKLLEGRAGEVSEFPAVGKAHIGPLEWIELAGHKFEDVQVAFSLTDEGPLSDPYTVGNIGRTLLEPFQVIFNYPQRKIAFVK